MDVQFRNDVRQFWQAVEEPLPDTVTIDRPDGIVADTYRLVQPPPYYAYVQTAPIVNVDKPVTVEGAEATADALSPELEPLPGAGPGSEQVLAPVDSEEDETGQSVTPS